MTTSSTHRDPRSIVTPDAFEVSEELLGMRLAPPRARLFAMLIDLLVIGLVTLLTRSFALVLGVVAAGFFMRAGFKRTPVRGSVFGRAMRLSVGCLGVFIALLTTIVWASCGIGSGRGGDEELDLAAVIEVGPVGNLLAGLATAGVLTVFEEVETLEEAEETTEELIAAADALGVDRSNLRRLLVASVPPDAPWAGQAEPLFDRLLGLGDAEVAVAEPAAAIVAELGAYTVEEALEAYAAALDADPEDAEGGLRRSLLQERLAGVVAGDSLARLEGRIADLEETTRSQQRDLESTVAALQAETSGGFFGWLRDVVDELGFGFGWASLYLTVFLSWWKGQTIGKRMMGIRVLRLDGEPITWWVAFERAGGYAAGFATGLLGFAQVYWDANRQAIHDRIVGTVVVLDGAEKVDDWEAAL